MDKQPAKRPARTPTRYWAIIPAAGMGRRMGANVAKQYLRIGNRTILELTIERLHCLRSLSRIVLALHPEDSSWKFLATSHFENIATVAGGEERFNSVLNGLYFLRDEADDDDWVLVHDAVRPCVAVEDMEKLMAELADHPVGGILATPIRETIKRGNAAGGIDATVNREGLWLAATPQMFRYGVLFDAMEKALAQKLPVTDEASAVEALGLEVRLVQCSADNIKITHPEDLKLAQKILQAETKP